MLRITGHWAFWCLSCSQAGMYSKHYGIGGNYDNLHTRVIKTCVGVFVFGFCAVLVVTSFKVFKNTPGTCMCLPGPLTEQRQYSRTCLERPPIGHKNVVSEDRWSLVTGSVILKGRSFCSKCVVFKRKVVSWQWSLKTAFTVYHNSSSHNPCIMQNDGGQLIVEIAAASCRIWKRLISCKLACAVSKHVITIF